MTASERLRELDRTIAPADRDHWPSGSDGSTVGLAGDNLTAVSALRCALPLIADVIEAAEKHAGHFHADSPFTGLPLHAELAATLTTLREALDADWPGYEC